MDTLILVLTLPRTAKFKQQTAAEPTGSFFQALHEDLSELARLVEEGARLEGYRNERLRHGGDLAGLLSEEVRSFFAGVGGHPALLYAMRQGALEHGVQYADTRIQELTALLERLIHQQPASQAPPPWNLRHGEPPPLSAEMSVLERGARSPVLSPEKAEQAAQASWAPDRD